MDRIGAFFREKTPRRALSLACFIGLLVLFRSLLVLVVFFVAFERGLGVTSEAVAQRFKWPKKRALLLLMAVLVAALGAAGAWGASHVTTWVKEARVTWPQRLAQLQSHPRIVELKEHLPDSGKLIESASHYAADAVKVLSALGHIALYALIGLILAIVFLLEQAEIEKWRQRLEPTTLVGTLVRWFEYLAEAVSVTVQLQLIVAACNTLFTLPVLFLLGIPDKPALMVLIFVSGLVPVIGNIVSGAVLSVLAWIAAGPLGVGVFLVLTFVLHKVEAYYLNPRLTARHVKLPGFVLIISLICWEHLLGFAGLFVSFPFLFISGKIRGEMKAEDETESAGAQMPAVIAVVEPNQAPVSS
jgi:predicted PurR-regulated permease PerM